MWETVKLGKLALRQAVCMTQVSSISTAILVAVSAVAAESEFSDVFTSGQEGYASIRIPAALVTKSGTLLAFAEGRQRPTDQAENCLLYTSPSPRDS